MVYKIENYKVQANSPLEAAKAVKMLKDTKVKDESNEEKIRKAQEWVDFDIKHHGEVSELTKRDIEKMGLKFDKWSNQVHDSKVKDEAFDRSTIEALIADEVAAIDAYNVAIANLEGKIPEDAIKVLQNIRDDEQHHSEDLYAILSNDITEKNLDDSIQDRLSPSQYKALKELNVSPDVYKNWSSEQASKFIESKKQKLSEKSETKSKILNEKDFEYKNKLPKQVISKLSELGYDIETVDKDKYMYNHSFTITGTDNDKLVSDLKTINKLLKHTNTIVNGHIANGKLWLNFGTARDRNE